MKKSPIRHKVRAHTRGGERVKSYSRGSGRPKRRRRLVSSKYLDDSSFHELIGRIRIHRNEDDLELFMSNFRHRVGQSKWLYRGISPSEYYEMVRTGKTIGTHYTIDRDVAESWARGDDVVIRIRRPASAYPREYDVHGYLDELEVIVPSGTTFGGVVELKKRREKI